MNTTLSGIEAAAPAAPLVDSFCRWHTSLRISVTDRCNIRCFYCMPAEGVVFRPREELLTFEEMARFVRALAPLGVNKIRLTGGEPLVRADLDELVSLLTAIDGVREVALTTNGMLLEGQAAALREAGLRRINVSEVMAERPLSVTPETGLREAALLMIENKIGGLPVVGDSGDVVGIITESDLFEVLVQELDREVDRR